MMNLLPRAAALALCIAGLPIHLLICLLIRLQDGGPSLYRCNRLGRGGRVYTLLKYRTMRPDCKRLVRDTFKVVVDRGDSRVTRLGRLLRCGIDELPQLWNIVRGDMAWIGPRPDEAWILAHYGPAIRQRLELAPGITGLAQVLGSRNMPAPLSYAIDIWYQRHRNFRIDLWVVAMTPLFMLGWRSAGRARLQRLVKMTEIEEIAAACESELVAAKRMAGQCRAAVQENVTA